MKTPLVALLVLAVSLPAAAQPASTQPAGERLGNVSFHVDCAARVRVPFDRGVALLHDFWYEEAKRQFAQVAAADPRCAMAHWGIAMSVYHQIWGRPDEAAQALAWKHLRKALAHPGRGARERGYVTALALVFRPGPADYPTRVSAYAAAMGRLRDRYPDDVDVAAFHALSLLAAEPVGDLSLQAERKALDELSPLFVMYPQHPGIAHYIIHAADSPQLAPQGLAAAQRYGKIAPDAPHAAHMPGHIFARLGLWQADIDANTAAVEASRLAEERHEAGAMYVFHSDEFLLYAYLQAAQDAAARKIVTDGAALIAHDLEMPGMVDSSMADVLPYHRAEYPAFLALELRDWQGAAALEPVASDPAESQMLTLWARAVADGHLREEPAATANLAAFEAQRAALAKGSYAYVLQGNAATIQYGEVRGWTAFAAGQTDSALQAMRESADLQDRVGQGEVDIPAREMLADMLLELGQPAAALTEYQRALHLSPQRFNGLYNAGRAAEALQDRAGAAGYYAALMHSTGSGAQSSRAEFDHVRAFLAAP
jgi:tetratricopeptide (TPR) repeat protein